MRQADPIHHAVVSNALREISAEMKHVVVQTARNPVVSYGQDFSIGITDAPGDLVVSADGLGVHLGSLDMSVRAMRDAVTDVAPGDVVLTNDSYEGANTHMPDFTMTRPVFGGDGPVAWLALRLDQADVGAKDPVRNPSDTAEIFNEGIRIPPIRVVEGGEKRSDLLDLLAKNTRLPETVRGDVDCMLGTLRTGAERLNELLDDHGSARVTDTMSRLLSATERRTRERVRTLPDGTYHGDALTDSNPATDEPVRVAAEITVDGDGVTVDLSESDEQVEAPINNTLAVTHSGVNLAWHLVFGAGGQFNAGSVAMVDVVAPSGLIVNAEFPRATSYGPTDGMQLVTKACYEVFADLAPRDASAEWSHLVRPLLGGTDPRSGSDYRGVVTEVLGGSGALWGQDGANCLGPITLLGGLSSHDPERMEASYPLHFHEVELRTDSGGSGRWRGGLGPTVSVSAVDHEALFSVGGDFGRDRPPRGLRGGNAGDAVQVFVEGDDGRDAVDRSWRDLHVGPGERYVQLSGGGGGMGDPHERPVERVRRDVRDGYVSVAAARDEYGVVLDPETLAVDEDATSELRAESPSTEADDE